VLRQYAAAASHMQPMTNKQQAKQTSQSPKLNAKPMRENEELKPV
jgi:hypothetical protein